MDSKISITSAMVIMMAALSVMVSCSTGFTPAGKDGTLVTPSTDSIQAPTNGLSQSNDGGSVTFDVKWLGRQNNALVFAVGMDTHSVDLDAIDLSKQSVLHDDSGKEYKPVSWQSAPGGHHRSGTLAFPVPDSVRQGSA